MKTNINANMRNLAAGLPYRIESLAGIEVDPDCRLTDGRKANPAIGDPGWVRFSGGATRGIVFDFAAEKSIGSVSARFLQHTEHKVFFPCTVSVYASNDGEKWGLVAHIPSKTPLWEPGPPKEEVYTWDGSKNRLGNGEDAPKMVFARYIKLTFTADLNIMLDGIEIWGVDERTPQSGEGFQVNSAYLPPGPHTGGIENLMLLYNGWYEEGKGKWTKENIIPYIGYVDESGEPQDRMFDGILYLGLIAPSGLSYETGTAKIVPEWSWYLDKTFGQDGDMAALNEAAREVGRKLNNREFKVKTVLMIPNPGELSAVYSVVEGELTSQAAEHLNEETELANKKLLVDWYMDQAMSRWKEGHYEHLELTGMYWLSEGISYTIGHEEEFIRYMGGVVHERGLKFFWIPFFYGNRAFDWKRLGFDAAVLQPNHFF
ncbi:DUF4855 domain-containing protein [Paenibacillus sp. DMB20]|uniref:DUF4855 domain-containing protein n=1 Tax=Paenibacillus sp. DMB20 TaxID=1642570 RepID=UPI0006280FAD|nr:DUF4855 domain-containing protein [Paenibacillus sp. DMB20]KKO51768.1 hypothetical protein XI25_23895 [Paenibacillus sp. DMB20]